AESQANWKRPAQARGFQRVDLKQRQARGRDGFARLASKDHKPATTWIADGGLKCAKEPAIHRQIVGIADDVGPVVLWNVFDAVVNGGHEDHGSMARSSVQFFGFDPDIRLTGRFLS